MLAGCQKVTIIHTGEKKQLVIMGLDNYLSTQSLPNMSEGHNEKWYEGVRRDSGFSSGFSSGRSSLRNAEEYEDDSSEVEKEVVEEGEEEEILKLKVRVGYTGPKTQILKKHLSGPPNYLPNHF